MPLRVTFGSTGEIRRAGERKKDEKEERIAEQTQIGGETEERRLEDNEQAKLCCIYYSHRRQSRREQRILSPISTARRQAACKTAGPITRTATPLPIVPSAALAPMLEPVTPDRAPLRVEARDKTPGVRRPRRDSGRPEQLIGACAHRRGRGSWIASRGCYLGAKGCGLLGLRA